MPFVFSAVLAFAGLGTALAVLAVNLVALARGRGRALSLAYCAVAAGYAAVLTRTLVLQSSGIACAMAPGRTLALYGVLLLLHLYFLLQSVGSLVKRRPAK